MGEGDEELSEALAAVERLSRRVSELEAQLAAKPTIDRASLYRVADLSPWGVLAVDRERRLDYANPAAAEWLFAAPPATGRLLDETLSPALLTLISAPVGGALQGDSTDAEVACATVSGARRELRLMVLPRHSGPDGITGSIIYIHDLTAGRARDEAVRDNEARLRVAVQAGRLAVWEFDVPTGKLVISEDLTRLLGYPAGATVTPEEIEAGYVREDWDRMVAAAQSALASGSSSLEAELRHLGPDERLRTLLLRLDMLRDAAGQVVKGHGVLVDITDRKRAEEALRLVVNELNHRVKNSLATVQSIAQQTLRNAPDLASAWDGFETRLVALAKAHDLITEAHWAPADLKSLIERAVAPVARNRMSLAGPSLMVSPRIALSLSLAIHELLTNAYRHGALSGPKGAVAITWMQGGAPDERQLSLEWVEAGGPPVAEPSRRGFGSRLLDKALSAELGGSVQLEFARTGARCAILIPLAD